MIALVLACTPEKPGSIASAGEDSEGATSTGGDTTVDPGNSQTQAGVDSGSDGSGETGGSSGDTCTFVCGTTESADSGDCDNWAQDCPDGEKCSAWANDGGNAWNSVHCVPVQPNAVGAGEPCTAEGGGLSGVDSCQKGTMCWAIDTETGKGVCVSLCTGSPEAGQCDDSSTACTIANDGVLNLCLPKCDPLLQDCPITGDLCLPNPNDSQSFVCVFDASADMGKLYDPCEYGNACDPGYLCAQTALATECDPQSAGCCLPFCDLSAPPSCPGAGQQCIAWYEMGMAPPGYENVGLCGVPMG